MTPRLVGFLSEIEREFFEMFCSVDGVGVRKALRAMVRPVREVAALIADQDAKGLAALPGIGPATAERIIAKLRRKMCKFALIAAREEVSTDQVEHDVVQDTFLLLTQLGHSETEARRILDETLATKQRFKDVDALLHAVYEQSSKPAQVLVQLDLVPHISQPGHYFTDASHPPGPPLPFAVGCSMSDVRRSAAISRGPPINDVAPSSASNLQPTSSRLPPPASICYTHGLLVVNKCSLTSPGHGA